MTRAELERHLQNPNVRKMLDLIAYSEGVKHGYNTLFGNTRFDDLSRHPAVSQGFRQTDGRRNTTTAAGRYQFIKRTWDGLAQKYGLTDFSATSQDIAALALIAEKGQLQNVLDGNFKEAVRNLGGVWASLPSSNYAQPKHSWAEIDKFLASDTTASPAPVATPTAVAADTATRTGAVIASSAPFVPQATTAPTAAAQPATLDGLFGRVDTGGVFGLNLDLATVLNGMGATRQQAAAPLLPTAFNFGE